MWMMSWAPRLEITGDRSTETAGSSGLTPSEQCAFKQPFGDESRSVSSR
jgi:hypothetical protein